MSNRLCAPLPAGQTYFDYNATTPPAQAVVERVADWLQQWGNPSSIHWGGRGPKALLRESRQKISQMIGAHPLEVIFTSGGSEANNLAIKGVFEHGRRTQPTRNHFITTAVEHPSVIKTLRSLEVKGAQVFTVPVNRKGELDLEYFAQILGPQTALVSMMYANNETGTIFPIQKLTAMTHQAGALFHCDAVQSLGKAVVDVKKWNVDLASFSSHKFYALKGCGVLYAKKGVVLDSLINGGGQERGRRAGTENLLAIAALGLMAERAGEIEVRAGQMKELRDQLQDKILHTISGVKVTGGESKRLANTLSLVIDGIDGESLLMNLDIKGFAVSTGAACSSGSPEPSPVLLAMGLSRSEAQASLRLSIGWDTRLADVENLVQALSEVVKRLRSFPPGEKAYYGL